MYLHVGCGKTVRRDRVVGIFDLDTATVSPITRAFLARADRDGVTASPDGDLPKSFVLLSPPQPKPDFLPLPVRRRRKRRDEIQFLRISSPSLRARAETAVWEEGELYDPDETPESENT